MRITFTSKYLLYVLLYIIFSTVRTSDLWAQSVTNNFGQTFSIENKFDTPIHITPQLISDYKETINRNALRKSNRNDPTNFEDGHVNTFFVRDILKQDTWKRVSATLFYKSDEIRLWIENSAYDTLRETTTFELATSKILELLYHKTPPQSIDPKSGILELLKRYAGDFPGSDGDKAIDVLLLDIIDSYKNTGNYVAGFFDPINLYDVEYSNNRDMLYLDLYPTLFHNNEIHVNRLMSTFSHESQHLIQAGYEGENSEITFVNEGFSEVIEILFGFEARSPSAFWDSPFRGLFSWNSTNPLPDYSRAALWMQYVLEQAGVSVLPELIQDSEVGLKSFKNILSKKSQFTFDDLFKNWGVALLMNDKSVDSRYGYNDDEWLSSAPNYYQKTTLFPDVLTFNKEPYLHIPIDFPLTKEVVLHPNNSSKDLTITHAIDYPNGNQSVIPGHIAQANQHKFSSIKSILSNYDSTIDDSSKISLSISGKNSGKIEEFHHGDGTPDIFYQNASYLLLDNEEIGSIFPPQNVEYWLKAIKISHIFESEIQGTSVSPNKPRSFIIEAKKIKNGYPSNEIIFTETITSVRPIGKLIPEEIDLSKYYNKLKSVSDSIFFSVRNIDASKNNIAVGLDLSTKNFSYYRKPDDKWLSLSTKKIGNNSLNNWNVSLSVKSITDIFYTEKKSKSIGNIEESLNGVIVNLDLNNEADTNSIRLISQLPDQSFVIGQKIEDSKHSFRFPLQVADKYFFKLSYWDKKRKYHYLEEKSWEVSTPDGFQLYSNYPNPFNPLTNIEFKLLFNADISYEVYNIIGRKVIESKSMPLNPGKHVINLDFSGLASGIYFFRAIAKDPQRGERVLRTEKLILTK